MKEKKNKAEDEDLQASDPFAPSTPPYPSPKPALPPRKPLTSFFRKGIFNSRFSVLTFRSRVRSPQSISRRPRLPPPPGDSPRPRSPDDNNNGRYLRPDSLIYDTVPDGHSVRSFSSSEEPERIEARAGGGDSPRRYKTEARIELGQRGTETVTSL